MKFKKMILVIKVNSSRLFVAIKKGVGKYINTVFLLMKPIKGEK